MGKRTQSRFGVAPLQEYTLIPITDPVEQARLDRMRKQFPLEVGIRMDALAEHRAKRAARAKRTKKK